MAKIRLERTFRGLFMASVIRRPTRDIPGLRWEGLAPTDIFRGPFTGMWSYAKWAKEQMARHRRENE